MLRCVEERGILGNIKLKERIGRANGATPAEARKFFGWERRRVTKSALDFTRKQLAARGWTRDVIEDVAAAYEEIDRLTGGHGNPSAAGRASQLREIVLTHFSN